MKALPPPDDLALLKAQLDEIPPGQFMTRRIVAAEISRKLDSCTDAEIGRIVLSEVWANLFSLSYEAILLAEAIQRLEKSHY